MEAAYPHAICALISTMGLNALTVAELRKRIGL